MYGAINLSVISSYRSHFSHYNAKISNIAVSLSLNDLTVICVHSL